MTNIVELNIVELNKFLDRTKPTKATSHMQDVVADAFSLVNNRLDVRDAYRPEGITMDIDLSAEILTKMHFLGAATKCTEDGIVMFTSLNGHAVTTMKVNPLGDNMYVWSFADVDPSTLSVG